MDGLCFGFEFDQISKVLRERARFDVKKAFFVAMPLEVPTAVELREPRSQMVDEELSLH